MQITIASGKGGTGKTTLATNLTRALANAQIPVAYVDCDVEEPNGHLFLRPEIDRKREVTVSVPEIDLDRCNFCGACVEACRFSALAVLAHDVLTFPELCVGCGGCMLACTEDAIKETSRAVGVVETGDTAGARFIQGRLNVGEAKATPVIHAVLAEADQSLTGMHLDAIGEQPIVVVDAPPGTSCPVIAAVSPADFVLLVTEPTPFGLHDLQLAVAMVRSLEKPFAVVINRAGTGDRAVYEYCAQEEIEILLELEDDRRIGEAYARGTLAIDRLPALAERLLALVPKDLARFRRKAERTGERAKELILLSGKGGTGKTSIATAFMGLCPNAILADCDVDASNAHLVLAPEVEASWPFNQARSAVVDESRCSSCGQCRDTCRFDAIQVDLNSAVVDTMRCEGCGVCVDQCPEDAVRLETQTGGVWFRSHTRHGDLVHARLGVAQENSGKLVALVREEARSLAMRKQAKVLLVDGPPGIGCPAISSITGADLVLVVAEPTVSALHDFERVAALCAHFDLPVLVCINKADLCPEMADRLEARASELKIPVVGRVRYDSSFTKAQVRRRTIIEELSGTTSEVGTAADDVRSIWQEVLKRLDPPRQQQKKEELVGALRG